MKRMLYKTIMAGPFAPIMITRTYEVTNEWFNMCRVGETFRLYDPIKRKHIDVIVATKKIDVMTLRKKR